ncbi:MAG: FtsX-like permease family protein, partial [Calditrichaeota bacterium]|nr:FtsX-like permease family protein [Calditrichota bacterium]
EFRPFTVCGIIAPAPDHSSIRFDMLIPFANSHAVWSERAHLSPFNVAVETYLQLPAGHGAADLAAKTPEMIRRLLGERYREGIYLLHFQPLTDIHLNTAYPAGLEPISDPAYSYLLAIVALLVFLIACINFTSLTLGRAGERAREVGVRKVVGAGRGQLIRQFWGETVLLSCFALLLGVLLAGSFLPTFNTLTGKSLALRFDAIFLGSMLLLMLLTGLVAGSYPAIFLSGFRPVEVLKGRIHIGPGGLFRRSLTVVQFALSVFLIICTLSIAGQLHYLQNKNLGFDKNQVLILPTGLPPQEGLPLYERLRNSLAGHQAIAGIGASAFALGEGWMTIGYDADDGTYRNFRLNVITPEFLETVGVELAMGRNFST